MKGTISVPNALMNKASTSSLMGWAVPFASKSSLGASPAMLQFKAPGVQIVNQTMLYVGWIPVGMYCRRTKPVMMGIRKLMMDVRLHAKWKWVGTAPTI